VRDGWQVTFYQQQLISSVSKVDLISLGHKAEYPRRNIVFSSVTDIVTAARDAFENYQKAISRKLSKQDYTDF
jgi:hypothetical protein